MARAFDVELAGKVRRLAFHQRDAITLKRRFNETPHTLVFKSGLGLDFSRVEAGEPARMNPALWDPEVQFAVLYLALARGGWAVTEDKVIDAVDEAVQVGGKESAEFIATALKCALYSGAITGTQVDLDAETDEAKAPAAEEKAPASSGQ